MKSLARAKRLLRLLQTLRRHHDAPGKNHASTKDEICSRYLRYACFSEKQLTRAEDDDSFWANLTICVAYSPGSRCFVRCPKCDSEALANVPAEIRLYRNGPRTMSHPPVSPSPDIQICLDCGWSEFSIPKSWLAGGWLRPQRPVPPAPIPFRIEVARTA